MQMNYVSKHFASISCLSYKILQSSLKAGQKSVRNHLQETLTTVVFKTLRSFNEREAKIKQQDKSCVQRLYGCRHKFYERKYPLRNLEVCPP